MNIQNYIFAVYSNKQNNPWMGFYTDTVITLEYLCLSVGYSVFVIKSKNKRLFNRASGILK